MPDEFTLPVESRRDTRDFAFFEDVNWAINSLEKVQTITLRVPSTLDYGTAHEYSDHVAAKPTSCNEQELLQITRNKSFERMKLKLKDPPVRCSNNSPSAHPRSIRCQEARKFVGTNPSRSRTFDKKINWIADVQSERERNCIKFRFRQSQERRKMFFPSTERKSRNWEKGNAPETFSVKMESFTRSSASFRKQSEAGWGRGNNKRNFYCDNEGLAHLFAPEGSSTLSRRGENFFMKKICIENESSTNSPDKREKRAGKSVLKWRTSSRNYAIILNGKIPFIVSTMTEPNCQGTKGGNASCSLKF